MFIAQNTGLAGTGPKAPLSPFMSLSMNCKNGFTRNHQFHVHKYYVVTEEDRTEKHMSLQMALWVRRRHNPLLNGFDGPNLPYYSVRNSLSVLQAKVEHNWLSVPVSAHSPTTPITLTYSRLNKLIYLPAWNAQESYPGHSLLVSNSHLMGPFWCP